MRPSGDGFDSERFRNQWVTTLRELRRELGFKIAGYMLEKREEKLNYMHKNPVTGVPDSQSRIPNGCKNCVDFCPPDGII